MHRLVIVEYENYRERKLLHMSLRKINCLQCEKECFVETREINRGNGKFCSRNCSSQHRVANMTTPTPNVKCSYCSIEFYINNSKKENSRSGLYFCCREHKDLAQRIGGIKAIQPDHYGEINSNYRTIAFRVYNKPQKCERCEYSVNEAAIIIHHKDRNRSNNDIDNLEVLCCNCHAIEHWGEVDKN